MAATSTDNLAALTDFVSSNGTNIDVLAPWLQQATSTGVIGESWEIVKTVIKLLADKLFQEVVARTAETKPSDSSIEAGDQTNGLEPFQKAIDAYPNPPFTVQRLLEVITTDAQQFKTAVHLLRALDKLTSVTTTIETGSEEPQTFEMRERCIQGKAAMATIEEGQEEQKLPTLVAQCKLQPFPMDDDDDDDDDEGEDDEEKQGQQLVQVALGQEEGKKTGEGEQKEIGGDEGQKKAGEQACVKQAGLDEGQDGEKEQQDAEEGAMATDKDEPEAQE
eukprot:m.261074 g.261074  ORF g.261074 m.261074 type:complete len:277 (+) comp15573_c0_seq1:100-930(+)